ncbi:unnamed protein product [Ectocarpus sp. 13 AM-2016]
MRYPPALPHERTKYGRPTRSTGSPYRRSPTSSGCGCRLSNTKTRSPTCSGKHTQSRQSTMKRAR